MAVDVDLAGLQASIARWMNRTDLTEAIPDFILLAEARIQSDLRVRQMVTTDTLTTTTDEPKVALPADWLEFKAVTYAGKPLEYMPADQLRAKAQ
jgi:hypothetical protein